MNKLYSVHDHWTDINKKNDVDIESIDGVITGIKVNGEDYGGSITWESVYSGSIDPEGEVSPFSADISLTMTASDMIKVVYDGVEYVLPKQVFNEKIYYGATPASQPADIDFSNCPFLIQVLPDTIKVYTETAGLHTLDISQPQSGGGGESDFSTANVTVIKNTSNAFLLTMPNIFNNKLHSYRDSEDFESGDVIQVALYKGSVNNIVAAGESPFNITGEGNVIKSPLGFVTGITGDCTITVSDAV